MKKLYIAPEVNMARRGSLVQIVCGSCENQGITPIASDDPVKTGFGNAHVGTYSGGESVDANQRGGFGSDSGPWESLW